MAVHTARIEWRSTGGFDDNSYSRAHDWSFDGGLRLRGSSSPHVVPVPASDPAAVDPEEALIAAAASCHMLSFLSLAQQAGIEVLSYSDSAEGTLARVARGKMAITRIVLRPMIDYAGPTPDAGRITALHHEAHERCFIANSLRTEIVVEEAG